MSMSHPQGPDGRPLTRREMRELEAQQVAQAQQAAQARQGAQPVQATPTRQPVQPVQPAQSPVQSAHASVQSARAAVQQAQPAQTRQSVQPTAGRPVGTGPASVPSVGLPQRQVVEPPAQPVAVSRRSMYSMPAGKPEVPDVIPPVQASAVRTLQDSGRLSNLVDPQEFTQSSGLAPIRDDVVRAQPMERRSTRQGTGTSQVQSGPHSAGAPQGVGGPHSVGAPQNVSGFLRQAPPSSQIPRIEEDGRGGWQAVNPQEVQQRLEREQEQRALLPNVAANVGLSRALRGEQPQAFQPQNWQGAQAGLPGQAGQDTQFGARPLPNRAEAQPNRAESGFSRAESGFNRAEAAAETTAPFSPFPSAHTESATQVSNLAAVDTPASIAPASIAPASIAPASIPPGAASAHNPAQSSPVFPGLAAAAQNSAVQNPAAQNSAVQNPGSQPESSGIFPGLAGALGAPLPGQQEESAGLTHVEDDDEDFEVDHSYTWLHYIILVAVALVLGMIIWKVGIDPSTKASAPDTKDSAQAAVVYEPLRS